MSSIPRSAPLGSQPLCEMRILRLEHGDTVSVRILTPMSADGRVRGCMTHYEKGTHYCDSGRASCQGNRHRLPMIWKGYLACEIWKEKEGHWEPCVLEVSEHLEHKMCERVDRGQVWELWKKAKKKGGGNQPLEGQLLEERDERTFPPHWDVTKHLAKIWRIDPVELTTVNPVPLPIRLPASLGDGPRARVVKMGPTVQQQQEAAQFAQVREQLEKRLGRRPLAAEIAQALKTAREVDAGNSAAAGS